MYKQGFYIVSNPEIGGGILGVIVTNDAGDEQAFSPMETEGVRMYWSIEAMLAKGAIFTPVAITRADECSPIEETDAIGAAAVRANTLLC